MSDIGKYYYGARFVTDGGDDTEYVMGDGTLSDGSGLNTTIGTDTDLTTSGAIVVDDIVLTDGVVISHSTRTLTLTQLGYTGDADANNYVHPDYVTTNINTSGAVIVDSITTNSTGHITGMGTRTLTLGDLGYTGSGITASNGLTETGGDIELGGSLSSSTLIETGSNLLAIYNSGSGGLITASDSATHASGFGSAIFGFGDSAGFLEEGFNAFSDKFEFVSDSGKGIEYDADYSATYTSRSLVDKAYVDGEIYDHPTHPGDDIDIDTTALTGAVVISDLDLNVTTDTLGHVTDANATVATRTLTLADLGFTGDTDANNITARTDEEIRDVAAAQWINGSNTTVVYDDAANTIKINAPAGGVVDGSGVQNYLVKWTDSDTLTDSIMHETNDRVGINVVQTNATFAVSKTGDETLLFEPNVSNSGRNSLNNFDFSDNSYVGMNYNGIDHQFQTSGVTKLTIGSTTIDTPNTIEADGFIKDGGTSGQFLMADGSVTTAVSSIDGSGTAKFIPRFSDSDTLEDSNIFEDNDGNILINTSTVGDGALNVYQTTTDPSLHLVTDDAGASAGPIIKMSRDSSSPADDDLLGKIEFAGNDSNGDEAIYGQMQGYINDTTVGGTLRGGFKLQSKQNTTMYTNLETVGTRGYLDNSWYVKGDLLVEGTGSINLDGGAELQLNSSSGTAGQVLSSNGASNPIWIDTVHSNTTEGGTGSVNIGNMVKITAAAHTSLGAGADADTLYIIVG